MKFSFAGRMAGFMRETKAVSALEYAILVGVITVAVAAALALFSETISDAIDTIGTNLSGELSDVGTSPPATPSP